MTDGSFFRSGGGAVKGPAARYQNLVDAGKLQFDDRQARVAEALKQCREALLKHSGGWFRRPQRVPGVYIHGGVGTGKTLLMDLFVQALAEDGVSVERAHFHRFMDDVHTRLKKLGNRSSPLSAIAAAQRKRARVLCFDEFHVEDIADAMLLGELSGQWFERGVTLVATSNQAPDQLYADGLQRQRFEPAIENLEANCRVIELDAAEDFRLRELERHPTWYVPASEENERRLRAEFDALCPDQRVSTQNLRIRGRDMPIQRRSGSLLWSAFADLCEGPRAASDYIELAWRFSTLMVSNIPVLDDEHNNAARRFIHLIDECYDRAVKLIATAEAPIEEIYTGKRLAGPFQRTVSRLVEMQSKDYLSLPHRS